MSSLIPAGAWLWDKYGGTVVHKAAGLVKVTWQKFQWNDAAKSYREKIKKLYGTMQIMGMAEPVSLDEIFTDVHMLDKPTAFARFDIEHLKRLSLDPPGSVQSKRINGLALVAEKVKRTRHNLANAIEQSYKQTRFQVEPEVYEEVGRNLFILGKPGAGKTTFLKYIALKAAEQTLDKIPIFISLKEWADSRQELLHFIAQRFDICDFPDATPFVEVLLKSGNAIALFDGLDEVSEENGRDQQTAEINNFVQKYHRTQCLITCRIAASDYSFKPFTYVEIADFTLR